MSNPKISVIVPVYNVAAYLREGLDGIINQTFSDFECILVDDGSTDGSGEICDRYAAGDSRFKVIHQSNQGVSAARNTGLDAAACDYVSWVDPDDVVHPRFLESLYRMTERSGAEIVSCAYERFPDGQGYSLRPLSGEYEQWSRKEALLELTRITDNRRGEFMGILWNKLFRRELFEGVRFPVGKLHEDDLTIVRLLMKIHSFCKSPDVLYFYRQRPESITGKNNRTQAYHLHVLDGYRERCRLLNAPEYRDIYTAVVENYFEMMIYQAYTVARPNGQFWSVYRRYLRELPRYARFIRGKRYFLFAACPYLYWYRHIREWELGLTA